MLRTLLPVWLKKTLKKILYTLQDGVAVLSGTRDRRYPPRRLNFVGSRDFKSVGEEFMRHFTTIGNLQPHDAVLDCGCGIGRMAIPLSEFLADDARYEGFDIDRRGITWCQKHITPQHPQFHFRHANIFNKYYNKRGKIRAQEFRFPYEDNSFDFAFAASVFTHMLADDIRNYLAEIHRVLRPGGKSLLTFFVLNPETDALIRAGNSHCDFRFRDAECPDAFFTHKSVREAEIGYREEWIRHAYKEAGFTTSVTIHPGNWSGRAGTVSYQDILLCEK